MLVLEGRVVNRKRMCRICREEGLPVRTKKLKKTLRPRVPMPVPRDRRQLRFIQPGRPNQNEFVQGFNGNSRAFCLDLHWFVSLDDARSTIRDWKAHYNNVRPHRSLGRKPRCVFAWEAA
jgi:transposase InsO family protein